MKGFVRNNQYLSLCGLNCKLCHQNQMNDMGKAQQIGIPAYNAEQEEKRKILDFLLASYNDGRRKNLFCIAVNLLEIGEIENILQAVKSDKEFQGLSKKEQASIIAKQLQDIAANKGIALKLRKK